MNYLLEEFSKFWTNFFVFPIVHQHVNLTIITCWRNEIFFEHFFKMLMVFLDTWHQSTFQNQIVSYMSVNFAKKNHFFRTRFFTFHQHVIHFLCKKRAKKRLHVVIFIKKNLRKNEKNKKNFSNFPNMWHKKSTFSRNFYIWVILRKMIQSFEKFHFRCFVNKFIKFSIANMKLMILTTVNTYQFSSVLPLIMLMIIY